MDIYFLIYKQKNSISSWNKSLINISRFPLFNVVRVYSEDFETIFNSRKCFCLDEAVVRNFLVENELDLTVTLSTV